MANNLVDFSMARLWDQMLTVVIRGGGVAYQTRPVWAMGTMLATRVQQGIFEVNLTLDELGNHAVRSLGRSSCVYQYMSTNTADIYMC